LIFGTSFDLQEYYLQLLGKQVHIVNQGVSDQQLLNRYKQTKDKSVLGQLYERYIHLVYGVSLKYLKNREEAQDATMQIFEQLVNKLLKHEIDNFKSWLHVLTRNHCLMFLRSQKSKNLNKTIDIVAIGVENEALLHHVDEEPKLEEQITKMS
jgi:RNA polymerase sigma-70 factor (ECF subfamily)